MKRATDILIFLLLLLSSASAQTFSDSLLPGKSALLGRFVPAKNDGLAFSAYMIAPDVMLLALDSFRLAVPVPDDSLFIKEDLDFFCRNILYDYSLYYGADSANYAHLQQIMQEGPKAPDFAKRADSAYKKVYLKVLSPSQKALLNSTVFDNWNMNNWALYQRSAAYRKAVDNKLLYLTYTTYDHAFKPGMHMEEVEIQIVNDSISNPELKAYFNYTYTDRLIKSAVDSPLVEKLYHAFFERCINKEYRTALSETYNNYKRLTGHQTAPDFSFRSIQNKTVSLQSLRGKYVYIDIWATWCGPCKAEIPHLQAIEKEYQGKNIQFVSISVDKSDNRPEWEKYVKEKKLTGIQLMADNAFNSDFIRQCNVYAIPRFLLIGPDGKIISGDALRPSDPALRVQLDKLTAM